MNQAHQHSPEKQKQYFEFAYQTGSDIWSHLSYRFKALSMMPPLDKDSLILDVGAGRGLWAMKLLEHGYRVLGIDYVKRIVDQVNRRIAEEGFTGRGRFILADVLNIPFTDGGFQMVTDVGTFQHIQRSDWSVYVDEVMRVLAPAGYYLNISLSRRTHQFSGFHPSLSDTGEFHKFGVHYYFFTTDELREIFQRDFVIIDQQFETYASRSEPTDDVVLVFTLMQRR